MDKQYIISQEQLEDISHYKNMFEYHSNVIKYLCESEKDDIVYGFILVTKLQSSGPFATPVPSFLKF